MVQHRDNMRHDTQADEGTIMAIILGKPAMDAGILTNNGDRMLAFYRDVLGLPEEPAIPYPGMGSIHRFSIGNSVLRVVVADANLENVSGGEFTSRNGLRYITLSINNIDEVVADCKNFGCAIPVDIRDLRPGVRCAQVQDPDGNHVEFHCAG